MQNTLHCQKFSHFPSIKSASIHNFIFFLYDSPNKHSLLYMGTKRQFIMKKIGLGLDYSNICKDYNTVYLDRDNNDKETVACMTKVLRWFKPFLSELLDEFQYGIYRLNSDVLLELDDIVQKRFLFYSLEKAITVQSFILQKDPTSYSIGQWAQSNEESLLIQNDEEGEGIFFYFNEGSKIHQWLLDKLKDFSLDEVPFIEK